MTISIPDRVIVLDYGRVVSLEQSPADRERIEELAGVGDAIWTAYRELRHPLDQGTLSPDEFWRRIGASVGRDWDLATRHALWSADLRSWLTVDLATVRVVDDLLAGGTRVVLLSNAGFDFAGPYRQSPLGARLEQVFVSAEHDLLKPDARLYRHVAETVDVPIERLVMIDDRVENVRGVEALGGLGHVHTDAEALRAFLTALS